MRYFFIISLLIVHFSCLSQGTDLPLNSPAYRIYDQWDIQGKNSVFTTVKPLSRKSIAESSLKIDKDLSDSEFYDLQYLQLECREYLDSIHEPSAGLFGKFFQYPSDFYAVSKEDFDFHLNPVVVLQAGKETASGDLLFENYRGVELRGTIDNKVSFYTLLTENQARYPSYVRNMTDSTLGIPYEGFWKQYEENGVDFLRAQAYIDFNITKHIGAQFGYGKHFIGNGHRSLILSDFGNNYPYLKVQTQIWKLQYTNIYAKLTAETYGGNFGLLGTGSFPGKHLALHHLSVNITDKLNIGLFESIVYGKPDSLGNNIRFEYLNPIIFYRALEQQDGSSDNAMLGMDFKWNLFQTLSLYGQLVIDELIVSKALSGDGYWENKQGFQFGAKYIDAFGLNNLTLQAEWNQVRPYTYAHQNNYTSYSHYNMPLTHPLGANFQEILFSATYRVSPRLTLSGDLLLAQYGKDLDSLSYGGNVTKSYSLKTGDVGIDLLQGDKTDLFLLHANVAYQWRHNLFTYLDYTMRDEESVSGNIDQNSSILSFGIRYNFSFRDYLF